MNERLNAVNLRRMMVKNVNVKTYDESVKPKYYAINKIFLFSTCTIRGIKSGKILEKSSECDERNEEGSKCCGQTTPSA